MFEPDFVPGEELMPGAGKIIQPTSIEEFEEMLDMWDAEGVLEALAIVPLGEQNLEHLGDDDTTTDPPEDQVRI